MKSLRYILLVLGTAAALALSLSAQQTSTTNQQQSQGMQMNKGKKTSNNQMMQDCHKNMQSMMKANTQTTKDIEAAKQSNDPAKMRAALDEAEKALTGMNDHMKMCSDMMNMMQNMHGKGGMMSNQEKQQQTTPPEAVGPPSALLFALLSQAKVAILGLRSLRQRFRPAARSAAHGGHDGHFLTLRALVASSGDGGDRLVDLLSLCRA